MWASLYIEQYLILNSHEDWTDYVNRLNKETQSKQSRHSDGR